MALSTSNSEVLARSRGLARNRITLVQVCQLLAVIALTCTTVEAGMWWYTHQVSRYVRHFEVEYNQAVSVRHGRAPKSVLIVGNSTLIYGVNADALRNQLGPGYECHVLAIESTTFLDWYFALKELFRRGAQPDYVVLILPANNVLELFPVPDFSAYYLIGGRDILALAWAENLRATAASEVAVEHFSAFYTSRGALRATVKKHLFPGFESMATKYMKQGGAKRPPASVTNRLRDLRTLCDRNGATIVFVIPPTNRPDATGASRVLELAREAQMAAAMPLPDSALTPSYYFDGFHLNEAGRDLFTANLAAYLRRQLISQPERTAMAQTAKN
jgi:hypothetical protein